MFPYDCELSRVLAPPPSFSSISFSDERAVEEQTQDAVKVTDTIVNMDDGIDAE